MEQNLTRIGIISITNITAAGSSSIGYATTSTEWMPPLLARSCFCYLLLAVIDCIPNHSSSPHRCHPGLN
jgi:hypothetical protein